MKKAEAKRFDGVSHWTRGDLLDDRGLSRLQATELKVKAGLLDAIRGEIEHRAHTN